MISRFSRELAVMALMVGSFPAHAGFVAHEWGTFTSLVGSDGRTQHGMYHEDEPLPDFVHRFGETQPAAPQPLNPVALALATNPRRNCDPLDKGCIPRPFLEHNAVTQKMETPVIYFHSDEAFSAEVDVRFPEGVVSNTFPGPVFTFPDRESAPVLAQGRTVFRVDVLSPEESARSAERIPSVEPGNIYGHARNVSCNLVRAGEELEKFIFYRGLGRFQPKLGIRSRDGELRLLQPKSYPDVPAAFLVHVNAEGQGTLLPLGALTSGVPRTVSAARIAALQAGQGLPGEASREVLIETLAQAGLFRDEAVAMVDTWSHGYLSVPGLRLLYILPREEVEEVLPLRITPTPERLERVFVGRIEILLDTEEKALLETIRREGRAFEPHSLGRFAEPMLRRLQEISLGAGDRALASVLDELIGRVR